MSAENQPQTSGINSGLPEQPPLARHSRKRPFWREILSTLMILLTAVVVALLLITYVFQSYVVDGPSMQNTLHDGNRLIVWKTPVTWASITGHQYVPGRGDIVVFKQSGLAEFGQADDRQLIKRVIGLPGDRVVVKDGEITIYNKQHPNGFDPDKALGYGTDGSPLPFTAGNIDLTLNSNELFVCGDNRPNSLDSRAFGPITTNQVVGKLILRVLPLDNAKAF